MMRSFMNASDEAIVRISSELTFLTQLVEAQREEMKKLSDANGNLMEEIGQLKKEMLLKHAEQGEIVSNLRSTLEAKEALEKYSKQLELQIDRQERESIEEKENGHIFEGLGTFNGA